MLIHNPKTKKGGIGRAAVLPANSQAGPSKNRAAWGDGGFACEPPCCAKQAKKGGIRGPWLDLRTPTPTSEKNSVAPTQDNTHTFIEVYEVFVCLSTQASSGSSVPSRNVLGLWATTKGRLRRLWCRSRACLLGSVCSVSVWVDCLRSRGVRSLFWYLLSYP